MSGFQHHSPELRLHCGEQALPALAKELDRLGCRSAVVFCGATLSAPGSALERLKDALGSRFAAAFAGVKAHSPVSSVEQGARCIVDNGADAVVALGGGSAIVTARAAGILAAEGGDVRQLCTRMDASGRATSPRLAAAKLPQFVVPTTPTTAIVKAGSAVHDTATGERLALFDPKVRAKAVFVEPRLLQSTPTPLVQAAALNAFAMAVEGLESAQGDPFSDAALMHALRLLARHLPRLAGSDEDDDARTQLALAAILCGQGTDFAGGGLASVLGHAIGPCSSVPNGVVNALVLPHTMRFNLAVTRPRLWKIRASLQPAGGEAADDAQATIQAVEAFLAQLSLPSGLRQSGLARDQFEEVAAHAEADFFLRRNPRPVENRGELLGLLADCW